MSQAKTSGKIINTNFIIGGNIKTKNGLLRVASLTCYYPLYNTACNMPRAPGTHANTISWTFFGCRVSTAAVCGVIVPKRREDLRNLLS